MERVAFIVDASGERIDCLLNPETLEVKRLAGVRPRATAAGQLVGTGLADDPVLFTGGGRTELALDLVFDVDLAESRSAPDDVRALTSPLWRLAENSTVESGSSRPPLVRFVWGKAWNLPGVIAAISERFDAFGAAGAPRRSWLRIRLLRVAEPAIGTALSFTDELAASGRAAPVDAGQDAVRAVGDGETGPGYGGVRIDLLAASTLGSPQRWRQLAEHNGIDSPMEISPGAVLSVPRPGGAL
jgi:Contractile injection system tube protein